MKTTSLLFISIFLIPLFISCSQTTQESKHKTASETAHVAEPKDLTGLSVATFASGCFWCMEGVYESVIGVEEVVSGYAGGNEINPTYEEVGSGKTDHAETVQVYYDSSKVSFETLLKVYFASQNPTQIDGQGPDNGRQYRSIIFYNNVYEKKITLVYIQQMNNSGKLNGTVAAQLLPFVKFWKAEDYHQDYILHNENDSYVQQESIPRIGKFQKKYPELIKAHKKY
ncbi:MAG: peptide-methionine (S)-S-oxide reductase MsrA [Bacteroidia bacterium]|nr:peptide-methionine (S)-S-oxide reductase MsrA [Bacteroidia bacterium]